MFMRKFTIFTILLCISLMSSIPGFAQSSSASGTTISFKYGTATPLYSSGAGRTEANKASQYFGLLRHNISHIQLFSCTHYALDQNGTGIFNENHNNLLFDNTSSNDTYHELGIWNGQENGSRKSTCYVAVVAPKGYKITSYNWVVDGANSYKGSTIKEYTYNDDGTPNYSNSVTLSSSTTSFSNSVSSGSNILYFEFNVNTTDGAHPIYIKELQLTYTIDQPFSNQLPSSDGKLDIHTGYIDPGEFGWYLSNEPKTGSSDGIWSFNRDNATDVQKVDLWANEVKITNPDVTNVDGSQYFITATNGDYYVSAPSKFRIVGATIKFLSHEATSTETTTSWDKASLSDAGVYLISDGTNYLYYNGVRLDNTTDIEVAKQHPWTFTTSGNGYIISNSGMYLAYTRTVSWFSVSYSLSISSTATTWYANKSYLYAKYGGNYYTYYVCLNYSNGWTVSATGNSSNLSNYASSLTYTKRTSTSTEKTYPAGTFTAKVFNKDNSDNKGTSEVKENGSYSVTFDKDELNNDAIHFSIADLPEGSYALYNVSLQLLPLNPELKQLTVASKVTTPNGTSYVSQTASEPVNYQFNDGNAVTLITNEKKCDVVLYTAHNEHRSDWYTTGQNTYSNGHSNYFLVNSAADNGGQTDVALNINETPYPTARVYSEQAGTKAEMFTNIDALNNSSLPDDERPTVLMDLPFSKTDAGYAAVSLTAGDAAVTRYVYSADMPTYNILPANIGAKHIDYRYYTLVLQAVKQTATPKVTLVPIYTSTMHIASTKGSVETTGKNLDTDHVYYGAKVTSNSPTFNYLSGAQVVEALSTAVTNAGSGYTNFNTTYGGLLYLDLSSLSSVTNDKLDADFDKTTADNCLYFMPNNYSSQVNNVIDKASDGSFSAITDVVITDQQPFFTPYDFTTTANHSARYTRTATNGKTATVTDATMVLPFDIPLNNGEYEGISFRNITGYGATKDHIQHTDNPLYAVKAEKITDATASANTPYHIHKENGVTGVEINLKNAQFHATPYSSNDGSVKVSDMTSGDTWKAHGNYYGLKVLKAGNDTWDKTWYFAGEYYWNAGGLVTSQDVNIRPFRAYYVTTETIPEAKMSISYNPDNLVDAINGVTTKASALQVVAGKGFISATAEADATLSIRNVAGQTITKCTVKAGENLRVSVPKGIYLVNDVKVIVK